MLLQSQPLKTFFMDGIKRLVNCYTMHIETRQAIYQYNVTLRHVRATTVAVEEQ
jgi:hypothetical protein